MIDLKLFSSLIDNNLPIFIGYSGGMDSHALLNLCAYARDLNYLQSNITAIHINHGISPNADSWQEHCSNICAELKIKFIAHKLKLAKATEELARKARLEKFKETIGDKPHNLLFAHHALDQAETILFRLFRGTSIDGIIGMQQTSCIDGLKIIRPLLEIDKSILIKYAALHNLQYVDDESNFATKYSRNYIRNAIVPLIQERWPQAIQNINNFAKNCSNVRKMVDANLNPDASSASLSIEFIKSLLPEQQSHLLAQWLKNNQVTPSVKHIKIVFEQVINARHDAQPHLKLANKHIMRAYNNLYILNELPEKIIYQSVWDGKNSLNLDFLDFNLQPINIGEGQLVIKIGTYDSRAKKIFQENHIPVWERFRYICIYKDQTLIKIINSLNHQILYTRQQFKQSN